LGWRSDKDRECGGAIVESTLEIVRLDDGRDWFGERDRASDEAWYRLRLAGPSPSNTLSIPDSLGIERRRSTVHNWVQQAELQPADGADPDHVAGDDASSTRSE